MRISDWSSDVCSSDLCGAGKGCGPPAQSAAIQTTAHPGVGVNAVSVVSFSMKRVLRIFLLATLLAVPLTAHGAWGADESLEDLLTGLTYDDPKPAIKALAASQDDKAKAAAARLAKGALFVSSAKRRGGKEGG